LDGRADALREGLALRNGTASISLLLASEICGGIRVPYSVRMIQEYYRQMRKFGCNILAVVQQYDVLKASEVRGAMIGNSKMFLNLNLF
jgi:hypothetical protein